MDEFGSDLAGIQGELVSPSTSNPAEELRKRRSTRIVQAVPLSVTGVDALGRSFQERTSTLIINCHGCRYQSKHYVLKNMWVTLEVPHPEADRPPRTVRGRVAWIQRPRTVRQLFQVAIELEVPGNVWGIAFPPEEWFPFPDATAPEIPLPADQTVSPPETEGVFAPVETEEVASGPAPDNLRVLPTPLNSDASQQPANQVARLLAEARTQIQAAAVEAAREAVAEETRISMQEWQAQFAAAREEISKEVARAVVRLPQESAEHGRASQSALAEALQQELPGRLAPQLQELTREIAEQFRGELSAQKTAQEQHVQNAVETLRSSLQSAEESGEKLRVAASHAEAAGRSLEEAARQREETAAQEYEALARTAEAMHRQLAASISAAEASWQERLSASLSAAHRQLQESLEKFLLDAQGQGSQALDQQTAAARAQIEEEAGRQIVALTERSAAISQEMGEKLAVLREDAEGSTRRLEQSLAAAAEPAARLEQFSSRIDALQHGAVQSFQTHVEELLGTHRDELHRRSEVALQELYGHIRSKFEESSQEAAARFEEQVRRIVEPHVSSAEEAVHRLAGGRSLFDAAMALQEDRIHTMTDEAFASALVRFRESLSSVEKELRESARTVIERNLADLDAKASDLKHSTIESLFKSAEWYEKKAQTQLQHLLEKGVEQAGLQLRERAGEISSVFATEVDHHSRNFMEHTQSQMEEVVRDAFERARALFAEAADTTCAAFTDEIQRNARQELDGFGEVLQKTMEESRTQAESVRHELGVHMTAEQEAFLRRFREGMTTAVESGVTEAQQQVQGGLRQVLESWRAMTQEHQDKLRQMYGRMGDESVEQFRGRLENVSNSWMVATVTSLDHQSRDVLAGVARAAEEKLRETCAQVFANVGETLRERLKEMAASFTPREAGRHAS